MSAPALYNPVNMPGNAGARKGEFQKGSYDLYTLLLPILQNNAQFAALLEPQKQAIIQQLLNMSTPTGLNTLASNYGAGQRGEATTAGNLLAGQLRSQGVSQSGAAGALLNAQNNATRNTFRYDQANRGLPGQFQSGQQSLGLFGQAFSPDALQAFQAMGQNIYGKPAAISHGGGLGDILGSAIGLFTGAGGSLGNLFGGGGGSTSGYGGFGGYTGGSNDLPPIARPQRY